MTKNGISIFVLDVRIGIALKRGVFQRGGMQVFILFASEKGKSKEGCETDNGDKYFHSKKQIITESKNNKNLI
jgi:hypothetical protein